MLFYFLALLTKVLSKLNFIKKILLSFKDIIFFLKKYNEIYIKPRNRQRNIILLFFQK
jgi:hypothetical protein